MARPHSRRIGVSLIPAKDSCFWYMLSGTVQPERKRRRIPAKLSYVLAKPRESVVIT